MGYRSQVRSIIYGEPDKVLAFWTKHKLEGNKALKLFAENIKRYTVNAGDAGTAVIDLYVDDWKWYADYEPVAAWDMLLDDATDNDLEYEFARVGENRDDIQYECSAGAMYWLDTRTEIVQDIPNTIEEETNEQDAKSQG